MRGCCVQGLCVVRALLRVGALLGVGTSHRVHSGLVGVRGGGVWWHCPAGGGTGHFVRCARSITCLEGRIRSRVHVGGVGRSCSCVAHGETSWITNSFGICIGNPRRTRAINRIHDFRTRRGGGGGLDLGDQRTPARGGLGGGLSHGRAPRTPAAREGRRRAVPRRRPPARAPRRSAPLRPARLSAARAAADAAQPPSRRPHFRPARAAARARRARDRTARCGGAACALPPARGRPRMEGRRGRRGLGLRVPGAWGPVDPARAAASRRLEPTRRRRTVWPACPHAASARLRQREKNTGTVGPYWSSTSCFQNGRRSAEARGAV